LPEIVAQPPEYGLADRRAWELIYKNNSLSAVRGFSKTGDEASDLKTIGYQRLATTAHSCKGFLNGTRLVNQRIQSESISHEIKESHGVVSEATLHKDGRRIFGFVLANFEGHLPQEACLAGAPVASEQDVCSSFDTREETRQLLMPVSEKNVVRVCIE
jgi:hypothetical protein